MKEDEKKHQEDTTKYGEFVCSLTRWLPIEKQKDLAVEMEKMTKKKNK